MKILRPLLLFTVLLLAVGLACNALTGGGSTPSQSQAPGQDAPPADESVASPSNESASATYFTEEFDQDPGWDYFLTAGNKDKITVKFDNSLMKFDIEDVGIYAYYIYEGQKYDNVRIDIRAENRGKNNNNVSLICRASEAGWYEFSTEGGGLWYLYAVAINNEKKAVYTRINNGGALALKQGKAVNEYGMICNDKEITLIINGQEIKKVTENKFDFRYGNVGFNISSLNVTPIILEVDWFKTSKP